MYTEQAVNLNYKKQKVVALPDDEFKKTWADERNYKPLKKLNDPRFGEVTVVKNPQTNEVLFVKEKLAGNKSEATEDINYLKQRLNLNHPNLLRLVNYTTDVKKELCSTHYISKAFYAFPRSDVYKEKLERKKSNQDFNHIELTHLVYQGLNGLEKVHSHGYAHGDVRPQMIGYDKSINSFTLLDRLGDQTNYEKCQSNNIVNNKELYMAPELYKKLKGKDKKIVTDAQKNDLFSLGMTVLEVGGDEDVRKVYKPDGTIDNLVLNERIMDFDNKHANNNPFLCNVLKTLLALDAEDRPDIRELKENMPSYDEFRRNEQGNYQFAPLETKVQGQNTNFFDAVEYKPQTYQPQTYIVNNPAPHEQSHVRTVIKVDNERTETTVNTHNQPIYSQTYQQPQRTYVQSTPYTNYTQSNVVYNQPNVYNKSNVEVRRGTPTLNQTEAKKITKRYVLRENGEMVELDANANLNQEEIKKHFDSGYNAHVVNSNVQLNQQQQPQP